MRRNAHAIAVALLAVLHGACAAGPPSVPETEAGRPAGVILISVVGLTADRYRPGPGQTPDMPTLAALARSGAAADRVAAVAPASSYPAHATLLTGRAPADHGIIADRQLGERGVRIAPYSHASHLRATTLWQAANERGRRVASLDWPSTLGAAIPMLVPDVGPLRRTESWLGVLRDSATPALHGPLELHGAGAPACNAVGPERDAVLRRVACDLMSGTAPPNLLLLRLSASGPPLEQDGPDSPAARAALARSDAEIRALLDCLSAAGVVQEVALFVLGDFAAAPLHTSIAPNAVLDRVGLIHKDDFGITGWSAIARSNGGSAFVYAEDAESALLARSALREEAERTRAFRVVSAEEMLALGADPEAWFGLEAGPGFAFDDRNAGPVLVPATLRGIGGYLPHELGPAPGLVAWGRGIRSGVRIPRMQQVDVAPTIARLLRLDLGEVEGRPLVGALQLSETAPVGAAPQVGGRSGGR